LKTIGDSYDRAEQPRQALALYSGAWSLDPTNTEAALYVALTLRDHAEGLDPGGRLLSRMTESVFEEKGAAYQKQDWLNILRQHVLLATIFEKEGKWGPRTNSHSAIFQWTNALRADDQIRQRDPNFPLSPGIYLHLGECHQRVGDPGLAWSAFAKASYAFLKASKPDEAASALERARSLVKFMTPEQTEMVRALENAIAQARKPPA
jgi:tetratricopeptide (TPR) repeat protein